ncbi:hypothetical protein ACT3S7_14725 [Corynebacterium sp. AOP34-AQ2-28]
MTKTHWKVTGWVMSAVTPIACISNPTPGLLILTAIVLVYWAAKWKKPLGVVCRGLIGTVTTIGGFTGSQLKKHAARRSAKGGAQLD